MDEINESNINEFGEDIVSLVLDSDLTAIADAIRTRLGFETREEHLMNLNEMKEAINNLPTYNAIFMSGPEFNNFIGNIANGVNDDVSILNQINTKKYFLGFTIAEELNQNKDIIILSDASSDIAIFGQLVADQSRYPSTKRMKIDLGQFYKIVYTTPFEYDTNSGQWIRYGYKLEYTDTEPEDEQVITNGDVISENTYQIYYTIQIFTKNDKIYLNSDCSHMFLDCIGLKNLILDNPIFDAQNVITMESMFENCYLLNLSFMNGLNTSNVEDTQYMFKNCQKLGTLTAFDTSKVTNMSGMFYGYSNFENGRLVLESIQLDNKDDNDLAYFNNYFTNPLEFDLTWMNTSSCTDMSNMFKFSYGFRSLNLSSFNTSNVQYMNNMFDMPVNKNTGHSTPYVDSYQLSSDNSYVYNYYLLTTIYVSNNFTTSGLAAKGENNKTKIIKASQDRKQYCLYMFDNNYSLIGSNNTSYNKDLYYLSTENYPYIPTINVYDFDPNKLLTDTTYARIDGGEDAPGYFTLYQSNSNPNEQSDDEESDFSEDTIP